MLLGELIDWMNSNLRPFFDPIELPEVIKSPSKTTLIDLLEEYLKDIEIDDEIFEYEVKEEKCFNDYNRIRSTHKFHNKLKLNSYHGECIIVIVNTDTKEVEEIQLFSTLYDGYSVILNKTKKLCELDSEELDPGYFIIMEDSINDLNLNLLKCRIINPIEFISFIHKNYSILLSCITRYIVKEFKNKIESVYINDDNREYINPIVGLSIKDDEIVNYITLVLNCIDKSIEIHTVNVTINNYHVSYHRDDDIDEIDSDLVKDLRNFLKDLDISSVNYENFGLLDYL